MWWLLDWAHQPIGSRVRCERPRPGHGTPAIAPACAVFQTCLSCWVRWRVVACVDVRSELTGLGAGSAELFRLLELLCGFYLHQHPHIIIPTLRETTTLRTAE